MQRMKTFGAKNFFSCFVYVIYQIKYLFIMINFPVLVFNFIIYNKKVFKLLIILHRTRMVNTINRPFSKSNQIKYEE